ncbi:hypothetical protein OF83DRAFT_1179882 [Amylostereum chailletii]|nr:hypothetical protein OF83DRAFT_1179882 [Amylostereum chailletii]
MQHTWSSQTSPTVGPWGLIIHMVPQRVTPTLVPSENCQPSNPPTLRPSDPPTLRPSDPPTLRPSDPPTLRPSDPPIL